MNWRPYWGALEVALCDFAVLAHFPVGVAMNRVSCLQCNISSTIPMDDVFFFAFG